MDPKITEEIKKQEDALDQSIALNKITVMLLDERKKELKKIWVFFSVVCVAFVALFAVFAYTTHKEKQELMTQLNDTRVDLWSTWTASSIQLPTTILQIVTQRLHKL